MPLTIGVDIGGSHISSAVIDITNGRIITNTYYRGCVDNKAPKEEILQTWADVINQSIVSIRKKNLRELELRFLDHFNIKPGWECMRIMTNMRRFIR